MKKKTFCIIVMLTFVMSISSLNLLSAKGQDNRADQYAQDFFRALQYGEKDEIYALWVKPDRTEESEELFDMLIKLWDGREAVSLKRTGESKRPAEGKIPSGMIYSYEVKCRYDTVKVDISFSDSDHKIDWIHLSVNPKVTGTLSTWRQFTFVQWLVTGLAALEILFSISMAYQCIRRKPRFWGVWLAFILLVYGGIGISTTGDLLLSFIVYTLSFPRLLIVSGVGIKLNLTLPIGAIIYWVEKGREKTKEVSNGV